LRGCLQGARGCEKTTQAELAEKIGVKPHHISEMENGKRAIGKNMAKRLSRALNTGYKVSQLTHLQLVDNIGDVSFNFVVASDLYHFL